MMLVNFKENIYKCSGCGLCQSVCPIYKLLKTESAVSRGKFKLLNAIINKDIKFSNKTKDIMDLCLHCQACSEFCPSGIDAQKIIETAQYDMMTSGIFNFKKYLIATFFANTLCLNLVKAIISFVRATKLLEFLSILNIKKLKLIQSFLKIKIKKIPTKTNKNKTIKVLYFQGCINKYINPSTANATEKILDKTNVEIIYANFSCCGLPLKSSGNFNKFKEIAKHNLLIALKNDFDYLVFDCASCKSTFLEYKDFLDDNDKIELEKLRPKIISIYELLKIINYTPNTQNSEIVTLHYPCHTRKTTDKEILKEILLKIPNIDFKEMNNADSCCGAAGSFMITNPKISNQISSNKTKNIIDSNANIVLTACPSCYIGLKQGLLEQNSNIEVMQLIEFLAK